MMRYGALLIGVLPARGDPSSSGGVVVRGIAKRESGARSAAGPVLRLLLQSGPQ
jgi:hypothetical protein